MKFRILAWVLAVFAAAFVLFSLENLILQRKLAEKTVRLHVVANSDSEEDQAQKLLVRDAVLREVTAWTADCSDASEAKRAIRAHLADIAQAASAVSDYDVRVSLGTEAFGTRQYDTFTLPAGNYPSLRVSLGAAEGKNWWCVVFPSLCMAATSDEVASCAEVGGFSDEETDLITGGENKYTYRFKALEWLQTLFSWF